jgi:hypothetical protein
MAVADTSELDAWARVLDAAAHDAVEQGERIVAKGSLNIKNRARELAPGSDYAKHYPASISYDVEVDGADIIGEIGPAAGRAQRGLGNLLEYGSSHNPPHPHHEPALDEEEPRFYEQAEALAARLVERHG